MAFFKCSLLSLFALCFLAACQTLHNAQAPLTLNQEQLVLRSLEGHVFELAPSFAQYKGTVLFFWATRCPCVQRYQTRMDDLFKRFAPMGVSFLAVSSNSDDDPGTLLTEKKRRQISMPMFQDPHGALAKRLGATGTPAAVLIDHSGQIRFRGWIDNERHPHENGRIAYLEQALTELLDDKPIKRPFTPMYGCPITRTLVGGQEK